MPKLTLLKAARELARVHKMEGPSLREAIPYLTQFNRKTFVLKIGGSVLNSVDETNQGIKNLVDDIVFLKKVGIKTVLVHGGSRQLDARMRDMGLTPEKINGLRVTSPEILEVANEVFLRISTQIQSEIESLGYKGLILGKDTGFVSSTQKSVELRCVGLPTDVNTGIIQSLADDVIPIVPAVTAALDKLFNGYNVNADDVASIIACKTKAEKLILMTDVDGVKDDDGEIRSSLTPRQAKALIDSGVINTGMVPKVQACLDALTSGVNKAHIIRGDGQSFMNEILTNRGVGTEFVRTGFISSERAAS